MGWTATHFATGPYYPLSFGLAMDSAGNLLVGSVWPPQIFTVAPDATMSVLAGSPSTTGYADGTGTAATFDTIRGVAIDASNNLYVAQSRMVRKVTPAGVVTTLAGSTSVGAGIDGTGAAAGFGEIVGITLSADGSTLYVTDSGQATVTAGGYVSGADYSAIRAVSTAGGVVTTFAGGLAGDADGTGTAARFAGLLGITRDGAGNLYVCDTNNHKIRKITPAGVVSTLASFSPDTPYLWDITDGPDGLLYVTDVFNQSIRTVHPGTGAAQVVYLDEILDLYGLTFGPAGELYVGLSNGYIDKLTYTASVTAQSNGVFFTVRQTPSLGEVGWTVRVLDYRDFATPVAWVHEYLQLTVGPELNAPGAGAIVMDADSPFWARTLPNGEPATVLLDREYLWECYEDGVLRFQFLGSNVDEHILEPDETRAITVSGAGIGHVLSWASVLPKVFPLQTDPGIVDPLSPSTWTGFPTDWSAMRIWLHMLWISQARGTIRFVTPLFTETTDSGGAAWEVVATQGVVSGAITQIVPEPGTNLLDLLNVHTGQDLTKQFAMRAEWFMHPGFKLDVRKTIGVHRENQVIFFEGNLDTKERVRVRDQIANYVVTVDVYGNSSFATDPTSIGVWQQREQLQNRNPNVTDPARRDAIGHVVLAQHKDENSQWTIKVPYDQPGRKVFVDYDIGDWIGISNVAPDCACPVDVYRVMAIIVNVTEGAPPTLELTLQSKLDALQRDLQQQLTSILNAIGTGGDLTLPNPKLFPFNPPTDGWDLGWSPTAGWYGTPWGTNVTGTTDTRPPDGGYRNIHVFIQPDDPADVALPGDFWIQTQG